MENIKNLLNTESFIIGSFNSDFLLINNNVKTNKKKLIETVIIYSSTEIHEYIHWFQFAGTTWGNFLLNLNQSIVELFNNTVYYSKIHDRLEDFSNITMNEHFYIDEENYNQFSNESLIFKQNWIDHQISKLFLFSGENIDELFLNRCIESIGYVRSDIYTQYNYIFANETNELVKDLDKLFSFNNAKINKVDNEILTINNLLESHARANDIIYKLLTLRFGGDAQNIHFFNDKMYWKSFEIYLKLSKKDSTKIKEDIFYDLIKFNAIVDIALNVPIFPYYENKTINWDEFYPIHRFYQLSEANSKIGYKEKIDNEKDYNNYVNGLCKYLCWPTPNEIAEYFINKKIERLNNFKEIWENNDSTISNYILYDYFYYLYLEFCKLRLRVPSIISNYGLNCVSMNVTEILKLKYEKQNPWFTCPLRVDEKTNHIMTSLKDIQYSWLLLQLLSSHIIRKHIVPNKKINNKSFPFIVKEGFKKYLIDTFKKIYEIDIGSIWI